MLGTGCLHNQLSIKTPGHWVPNEPPGNSISRAVTTWAVRCVLCDSTGKGLLKACMWFSSDFSSWPFSLCWVCFVNSVLSHVSLTCRTTGGSVVTRHIRSGICWNNPDSLKYGESTVQEVEEEGRGDDDWVIWGMKGDWTACCEVKSWSWWKWAIQLQEGQLTEYTSCQWPCWPSERTIKVQPRWHLQFLLSSGQEVKRPSSSQKWTLGEGKKLEDYTALGGKKKNSS